MSEKQKLNIRLQGFMAVASFCVGSLIACVCLFAIEPLGEIASTAITVVSEFLILTGALLGVDVVFSHKIERLKRELKDGK